MVMGIFWKGASRKGVVLGMLLGLSTTLLYMTLNVPTVRAAFHWAAESGLFLGIQPISAGILGVPVGFLAILLGSWAWPDRPISPDEPESPSQNPYPGL